MVVLILTNLVLVPAARKVVFISESPHPANAGKILSRRRILVLPVLSKKLGRVMIILYIAE